MKNDKNLYTISRKDCLSVYKDVQKNADEQWSIAELLAEKERYGPARSHLIISIEELVKSTILILDGNGFDFRKTKGMKRYFNEHGIRFYTALLLMICSLFGSDFLQLLDRAKTDQQFTRRFMTKFSNQTFIKRFAPFYFRRKIRQMRTEAVFFIALEGHRQSGFYADYCQQLHTPATVSAEEYKIAHERLQRVRSGLNGIITACNSNNEEIRNMKELYLNTFKKDQLYKRISAKLASRTDELFSNFNTWLIDIENYRPILQEPTTKETRNTSI